MAADREELQLERIFQLMRDLLKGRIISLRQFNPEPEDSMLWTRHSGLSLSESLMLTGPPALPLSEEETGIRVRDLLKLQGEELIRLFNVRGSEFTSPFRWIVLFSLAWRLVNLGVTQGLDLEELRAFYLKVMRDCTILWGKRAREAFFLFALSMEDFLRTEEDLDVLSKLFLYPLAFSASMSGYVSQELMESAPKHVLSKMLAFNQDYCVKLPSPKRESMELLLMAQRVNESYRELRSSIMSAVRRFVCARPRVDERVREVLDQLSRELSDWSLRRRFELKGAKVRRRVLRFLAFYPSAPELWLSQQERTGMLRLESESEVNAAPWPFRERGVAYVAVSSGAS